MAGQAGGQAAATETLNREMPSLGIEDEDENN
jgi:hypothetical protein